jgi:hydroxymethylpyrimidine/phosphomethylpyrimidine kinase
VQNEPQVIKGYASAILTPNVNEFQRLCESQNISFDPEHKDSMAMRLSQALGNVTIVQKGDVDVISNGKSGGFRSWSIASIVLAYQNTWQCSSAITKEVREDVVDKVTFFRAR